AVLAEIPNGWPLGWAPDSRAALVLDSDGDGASAIVVIGRDGETVTRHPLPDEAAFSPEAAWRPGS
ncbi:MAG: hypothetical protein M3Y29_00705, partial [Chloroflexota bacterium]|nr:hypothetical protein [Chloroflexota bacterium]